MYSYYNEKMRLVGDWVMLTFQYLKSLKKFCFSKLPRFAIFYWVVVRISFLACLRHLSVLCKCSFATLVNIRQKSWQFTGCLKTAPFHKSCRTLQALSKMFWANVIAFCNFETIAQSGFLAKILISNNCWSTKNYEKCLM